MARFQGKRIYVEERLGGVAIGRLTDVGPSSLTVTTPDRTRPIERSEITRVLRDGDSIKEGAILAAVGGVLLSLLDPFKGEHRCDSNCGWKWVAGVGMLAAAGGWLDYRVGGMTVVYQSTPVP